MKRHESLAPFSREHHTALILAQLLKKGAPVYKGLPTSAKEKISYAINLFHDSLEEHFRKEEALLEIVQHCHEDIGKLGKEIVAEHAQLTEYFLNLDISENPEDSINTLGIALEKHIRKEERVLFPLIQRRCSEEILNKIGSF